MVGIGQDITELRQQLVLPHYAGLCGMAAWHAQNLLALMGVSMAQAEILNRITNNEYAFMGLRLFVY